jgi:NADPH-dependent glutamate synthase beta subunit-like oxidoreductase
VIDEEVGYITGIGNIEFRHKNIDSMKAILAEGFDAVFVGCGAPRGRELDVPGRKQAAANIHIGIDWLSSVSFGHTTSVGKRVIVLGGGNTAMDCCRTARRLGGIDVKVIVRSGFEEMKASPWEKEDAMGEDIPILNFLVPKEVTHDNGKITGVLFEKVRAEYDAKGRRSLVPSGQPDQHFECDDVLVAIGQENAFPWIEKDAGIEFDRWGLPKLNEQTLQSGRRRTAMTRQFPSTRCCWARTWLSGRRPASTSSARRWASTSGATTTRPRSTPASRFRTVPSRRRSRTSWPRSSWASIPSSPSMRPSAA